MELFFSPLACSMASRIAFYEAGAEATYSYINPKTKRLPDGSDYRALNPLGYVPALRTDEGAVLTENAAILQYIADQLPEAKLAPKDGIEGARLQQWLCFIGTELHKGVYSPLLVSKMPAEAKAYALEIADARLRVVDAALEGREFLLDDFSVADAYLFTVLHWSRATPIDLRKYAAFSAYMTKLKARPSIARALGEELALYVEEQERNKAA